MANPDKGDLKPPPNLRVSQDEGKECDSCTMFTQRGASEPFSGRCTGYSLLPVDGEWVCDSYDPKDKGDIDDDTAQEDQPKSLQEAAIRVRAHYRRRRVNEEAA